MGGQSYSDWRLVVSDPIETNRVWGDTPVSLYEEQFQTLSKPIGYGGLRTESGAQVRFQTLSKPIGYGGETYFAYYDSKFQTLSKPIGYGGYQKSINRRLFIKFMVLGRWVPHSCQITFPSQDYDTALCYKQSDSLMPKGFVLSSH